MLPWLIQHHKLIDIATETVAVCSVLHNVLPPYNWEPEFVTAGLAEFPAAQKAFHAIFNNRWYRFFVYLIGYVALNARSTVWRGAISLQKKLADAKAEVQSGQLPPSSSEGTNAP